MNTGEKELRDLAAALGAGDFRLRLIRCTCRRGQWPCECTKEAVMKPVNLFAEHDDSADARRALISPCGQYRYWLTRATGLVNERLCCFVMLNPSTADATQDDPTIRRCVDFARRWGYARLIVRNLYSYRASKPAALWTADDPIGPEGDAHLALATEAEIVVAAWGVNAPDARHLRAIELLTAGGRDLYALNLTATGRPQHPLYVKGETRPGRYVAGKLYGGTYGEQD